jgi:hypothetical protein
VCVRVVCVWCVGMASLTAATGLPAGIPALLLLIVLLATVVVAMRVYGYVFRLPHELVSTVGGSDSGAQTGRFFALACAWVATPFWAWSLQHILSGGLDAGGVTFLVVMLGAAGYCGTGRAQCRARSMRVVSDSFLNHFLNQQTSVWHA